jgi:hypothetical protein
MEFVRKFIQITDMFGAPISLLNIRGETQQKSMTGGVASIVIWLLLITFTLVRFQKMAKREDPIMYQVDQVFNLNDPEAPEYKF